MADDSDSDDWLSGLRASGDRTQLANRDRHGIALPHPSKRSRVEHFYMAAKMREKKAHLQTQRAKDAAATATSQAVTAVNRHGVFCKSGQLYAARQTLCRAGGVMRGIVIRYKTAERGRRAITFSNMLDMGFGSLLRTNDLSRQYRISKPWVGAVLSCVAQALLTTLHFMLAALAQLFAEKPPTVFVSSIAFDETTERLKLPLNPELLAEQQQSSWHVLVSTSLVSFAWVSDTGQAQSFFMECLRPVVPLLGTCSKTLCRCWAQFLR